MRVDNKVTPEPKSKMIETKPEHKSEQLQDKTLQLLVPNSKRLGGYTHPGKHLDDACTYSAGPEGTRRGFQNSTMKCSGACPKPKRRN